MTGQPIGFFRGIVALLGTRLVVWATSKHLVLKVAENYNEHGFVNARGDRFIVTFVKAGGKTPHELKQKAEARLAALTGGDYK